MDQPDLRSAENYINRELSLLEFNERVLAQALDGKVPLLERLKFLCISSNNLDEFFEIRVAGLKQRIELGSDQPGPDGLTITEQLHAIHDRTRRLVDAQYACLNDILLPELRLQGMQCVAGAMRVDLHAVRELGDGDGEQCDDHQDHEQCDAALVAHGGTSLLG